jgi:pSer/pThr/pTyr-binding forkhead associated (FHA) protein
LRSTSVDGHLPDMSDLDELVSNAAPKTPVQTDPLGDEQREAWYEGPDVVTALRVYDGDREYPLPQKAIATLGASRSCDVSVPGRGMSALHCALVRKGSRLRVLDQHSTNGLFSGGRRVDLIDLYPGDTFTAAPLTLLALNDEMRVQRQVIADIVGTSFTPTPDRVLVDAVKSSHHLLLTGEPGCDLDRLARAIHAVSLRRSRTLVQIAELSSDRSQQREILKRASRSTLLIDLESTRTPLDPTFCAMAFSPDYHIRVIVIAATPTIARRLLSIDEMERLQHIWIRPIAMRPGDVPELFDRLLAERQAPFRLTDLASRNRDALCSHDWRDNFNGLRLAAERLTAISRVAGWEEMNWQERSIALAAPKTTIYEWFNGLGLTAPLFAPRGLP